MGVDFRNFGKIRSFPVIKMAFDITVENELESFEMLKALKDRKEECVKHGDTRAIESIDSMIEQFENQPAYQVLIED